MLITESVISNGVDKLAEILRSLDENNMLLINMGSFIHKEKIELDSRTEISLIENALNEKKIKRTGKIEFEGVPIKYTITIKKDIGEYKRLYIRYLVANEVIKYETTLKTLSYHKWNLKINTTNIYAIEVSVRPLYETALFAFNINYRIVPILKPKELLNNEITYRKILVSPDITREGTLLWKIKTMSENFKQTLLSVLQTT